MPLRSLGRGLSRLTRRASVRRQSASSATSAPGSVESATATQGSDHFDIEYSPTPDGQPDPGEVVWTWVPYEDDPQQGKDRPVLIIGHVLGGRSLAGLMLTSKDHDLDYTQEANAGRHWMDVGTGDWDTHHRPSEVRLDRLITVDPDTVRREGAALDEALFHAVVAAARPHLTG